MPEDRGREVGESMHRLMISKWLYAQRCLPREKNDATSKLSLERSIQICMRGK